MRLADLAPGDVVEHPKSGFTWVVLRVEPTTRMFQWAPMSSRAELVKAPIKPRWSPPHDEACWGAELDAIVKQYRR